MDWPAPVLIEPLHPSERRNSMTGPWLCLQADDSALERSTAIHNRALQLHQSVLDGYVSSDKELIDMCVWPPWPASCAVLNSKQ